MGQAGPCSLEVKWNDHQEKCLRIRHRRGPRADTMGSSYSDVIHPLVTETLRVRIVEDS